MQQAQASMMVEEKRVEVRNTHVNQIHCMRSPTLSHTRRRQKICVCDFYAHARARTIHSPNLNQYYYHQFTDRFEYIVCVTVYFSSIRLLFSC